MMISKARALYVHVPFCRSICSYCDFCHKPYQSDLAAQWLNAIETELSSFRFTEQIETIYLGGGTPTALSFAQLERLLALLDPYTAQVREYTCEINPETLDEDKAQLLKDHGVNRASIGYQTDDKELLKLMNRHHDAHSVNNTMALLRSKGINNISLDLMYSLPGQTMASLKQSVHTAIAMKPDHLSLYSLTIEPGTLFALKHLDHLDEDTEADMYEWIMQELPKHGYHQYEISNFALPGKESLHNQMYWNYQDFAGIGCGASGKEGTYRYDHTKDVMTYLKDPCAILKTELSEQDQMFEALMMGLRLRKGLNRHIFKDMFGKDINEVWPDIIAREMENCMLAESEDALYATDRGFEILNDVLEDFL
ncbi:MAG: radical SAM family heme chaperone HemW [Bulleidia sp.]|nr:radical SAM family heme chaperone HemW [Bulleidia sp.]